MKTLFFKRAGLFGCVKVLLIMTGMFAFAPGWAQESSTERNAIFTAVEHVPEFPGGINEFFKYVSNNIKYPAEAREKKIEGRVIVTFIVEKDGSLSDVRVLRSPNDALSAEAVRVVAASPKWKPGLQNSHTVRVQYTIPVIFDLGEAAVNGKTVTGAVQSLPDDLDKVYIVLDNSPVTLDELKKVNVNTIDHVVVLKDKTAIEKYGDKAVRGAVEIITKKK